MFLAPAWWLLTSISAYRALYELVLNARVWHKTPHVRSTDVELELEAELATHMTVDSIGRS